MIEVGVPGATVDAVDNDICIVKTKDHGVLRVPQDAITDNSEVWRVGDSGTLIVSWWWAKKNGVRGDRIEEKELEGSSPVELMVKASKAPRIYRRKPPEEIKKVKRKKARKSKLKKSKKSKRRSLNDSIPRDQRRKITWAEHMKKIKERRGEVVQDSDEHDAEDQGRSKGILFKWGK